ncbi:hypothetical protein [Pseudomonas caspiana]|uniref:Phage infection protein n=1 Tax=Pseudomonas caspiana TaxID=1451454 RepID=A0A1Y3P8S7_9PSED|nr:hypothetical protein AUC60_10995 [Pseudomonas caspiana]
MKTSQLIFGLTFSVLASSVFASPQLPSLPGNDNTNLIDPTPATIVVAEGGTAHTNVGASRLAADGADRVGANRVAADGADHVGANRVAADGADHVGANRVAADGADHVGANRVAADGADHVGANRLS